MLSTGLWCSCTGAGKKISPELSCPYRNTELMIINSPQVTSPLTAYIPGSSVLTFLPPSSQINPNFQREEKHPLLFTDSFRKSKTGTLPSFFGETVAQTKQCGVLIAGEGLHGGKPHRNGFQSSAGFPGNTGGLGSACPGQCSVCPSSASGVAPVPCQGKWHCQGGFLLFTCACSYFTRLGCCGKWACPAEHRPAPAASRGWR